MAEKLTRLGIHLSQDDIINSQLALAQYLRHETSAAIVYVQGELSFVEELTTVDLHASAKPEEKNEKQHCLDYGQHLRPASKLPKPIQDNIEVVPLTIIWGDEQFRDGVDLEAGGFYERLVSDPVLPTTSQPTPQEMVSAYQKAQSAGAEEILIITISSAMSGTYTSASKAAELMDIPVHVLDSRANSMSLGWQVLAAASAREKGADLAVMKAKQLIDERFLGDVVNFRAQYFHTGYLNPEKPMSWRLTREKSGGGALVDLGAHVIDLMLYLAGSFKRILAQTKTFVDQRPKESGSKEMDRILVDDHAQLLIQLIDGGVGIIEVPREQQMT